MKVYGFGDTLAGCYQFSTLKANDDWKVTRDPVTADVGGSDGAYDYFGSENYPVNAATISKTFTLLPAEVVTGYEWVRATGWIYTYEDDEFFPGIFNSILPEIRSQPFSPTTVFTDEFEVGDPIRMSYLGTDYDDTVASIASDTSLTLDSGAGWPEVDQGGGGSAVADFYYQQAIIERTYASLDIAIDELSQKTIAQGESKLWFAMRDGTYRWCWAKCVSLSVPEKIDSRLDIEVSIEFYCREGLMYNETQHYTLPSVGSLSITNAGDYPAAIYADIAAGTSALTQYKQSRAAQYWEFVGTLASGKHLIVDSAKYKATNDGAGCYSSLSFLDKDLPWMTAPAGATTIFTITKTGSPVGLLDYYYWYDTWII